MEFRLSYPHLECQSTRHRTDTNRPRSAPPPPTQNDSRFTHPPDTESSTRSAGASVAPPTRAIPGHELELEHQLHSWDEKGERFAGASLRGAHQVFAFQKMGN